MPYLFNVFVKISFFKMFVLKNNTNKWMITSLSFLKPIIFTSISIIDNYYVK